MKERPILLSAPMVRAILAGTKTQTRLVVKPDGRYRLDLVAPPDGGPSRCPYGQPGDRLWVREAICQHNNYGFPLGHSVTATMFTGTGERVWSYAADKLGGHTRVRPPIHMPRWASRITLEVTGVRVERLQDISEADAIAEGVPNQTRLIGYDKGDGCQWGPAEPVAEYRALWESINGPGSWAANPWVWVVEFKREGGER